MIYLLIVLGLLIVIYTVFIVYNYKVKQEAIEMACREAGQDLLDLLKTDELEKAFELVVPFIPEPYRTELSLIENILKQIQSTLN